MFRACAEYGHFICLMSVHKDLFYPMHHLAAVFHLNIVSCSTPSSGHLEAFPICRNAGIDDQAVIIRTDSQHISGSAEVGPAAAACHEWMSCSAECRVIFACNKLTIGIGFGFPDLDPIILPVRTQCIVEFHCQVASAADAGCCPCPGIGMGENSSVFLQTRIYSRYKSDIIIGLRIGRSVQQ